MKCPHCKTEIDEHEANRCLDAWVAEAVMGHRIEKRLCWPGEWGWEEAESTYDEAGADTGFGLEALESAKKLNPDSIKWCYLDKEDDWWEVLPEFSTDIAAAWEVGAKFPNWMMDKSRLEYVMYVEAEGYGKGEGRSNSAPLAICRAALKAAPISVVKEVCPW